MSTYLSRADAVRRVVPKGSLQAIATGMAMCGPHAIDYIMQAPVLALSARFFCDKKNTHAARNAIVETFAERVGRQPKLRDLMAQYGVAYGFRALRSSGLSLSTYRAVHALSQSSDLHPSALAQAIPDKPRDQARWLKCITAFGLQVEQRSRRLKFRDGLDWAAVAFTKPVLDGYVINAQEMADLFVAYPERWNRNWTCAQARAATVRWHDELARTKNQDAFRTRYGIGFDEPISYDPLPLEWEYAGLRFVALNSGEALFEEGRAMHHCVASYARDVIYGKSRIYSIRLGDVRVATVELTSRIGLGGDIWRSQQLRGPCNSPVSDVVYGAVATFLSAINEHLVEGVAA